MHIFEGHFYGFALVFPAGDVRAFPGCAGNFVGVTAVCGIRHQGLDTGCGGRTEKNQQAAGTDSWPEAANKSCARTTKARLQQVKMRLHWFVPALMAAMCLVYSDAQAAKRSARAVREFKAAHHCPSTGRASGRCPGYVVDHIQPLACGGADAPSNMQWQTIAEGKAKDRWERKFCGK